MRHDRVGDSESLVTLLRLIRRRWLTILGTTLLLAAAAAALQSSRTPEYEGVAQVLFGEENLSDRVFNVDRGSTEPERDAATQVLLATSESVASAAAKVLKTPDVDDLVRQVEVEPEENADVLRISARDPDATRAAAIANAFATAYVAFKTESETESLKATIGDLRTRIEGLGPDAVGRAELETQLQSLLAIQSIAKGDARLISKAAAAENPSGLGTLRTGIVGAVLGLTLGLMLAFLLESLDRRMKDLEDFEREYRSRVLAVVPERVFTNRAGADHLAELEPFRILRSGLDLASVARPLEAIVVTSAVPGEGKTTVAVDLAHAIALAGRRVALIELDLRRPTFARHFSLSDRTGVTTALVGRGDLDGLLQHPLPSLPSLEVLPAGPLPPNPAELLDSAALRDLLAELKRRGSMLIIDAPPLIPVADSHVLLRHPLVDGAIVVARAGVTSRDEVRRARAIMDGLAFDPLGLVITGHEDIQSYYGPEGYGATDPVRAMARESSRS